MRVLFIPVDYLHQFLQGVASPQQDIVAKFPVADGEYCPDLILACGGVCLLEQTLPSPAAPACIFQAVSVQCLSDSVSQSVFHWQCG